LVHSISEVSPRPEDAGYTFNVSPDRQAWVEEQVRLSPATSAGSKWAIRVKQLGPNRQQIQLEAWRDGFTGLIYEAGPDSIRPLRTRHAGVLDSMTILGVHLVFWGSLVFLARLIHRLLQARQAKAI
jgi:hypothetical protein